MRKKYQQQLTLSEIPQQEWETIAEAGFHMVWLMGVWERSPGSRASALAHEGLRSQYDLALPEWEETNVRGSPYAIHSYRLDPFLGTPDELPVVKELINAAGLSLILDFVPNHLSLDHPWTEEHPDFFVRGSPDDLIQHPGLFFETLNGSVLAHGKDPYFDAWQDTAQINFFSPGGRRALIRKLVDLSQLTDGVRCDMAMLALNEVFQNTWRGFLDGFPHPRVEFWKEAIDNVHHLCPDFLFMAEVYWDLEKELLGLGFDYTYDKRLYDLLSNGSSGQISEYLRKDPDAQKKSVRFIENHDEPRARSRFGLEKSLAAAAIAGTIPGLHLFHDGQREGYTVQVPVQLDRQASEVPDQVSSGFYRRLLSFTSQHVFRDGIWEPLELSPAWEGNMQYRNLLAWSWHMGSDVRIIVVNFAAESSQARVNIHPGLINTDPVILTDLMTDAVYERDPGELSRLGLYVDLSAWKTHLFSVSP
ncbi:MAG: hypothetical protein RRA35_05370 [Desulfomonilia bacterium]|nr:hypothetical protein [Desulfomonilia bacterium]